MSSEFETREAALTWMRETAAEHLRARGAPLMASAAMRAGGEERSTLVGSGVKGVRQLQHYLTLHLGAAADDPDPAIVTRIAAAVAILDPAVTPVSGDAKESHPPR